MKKVFICVHSCSSFTLYFVLIECAETLPIFKYRDAIINSLKEYSTTIIVGETGCGKSTQLPQYIADFYLNSIPSTACFVSEHSHQNKKQRNGNIESQNRRSFVVCTQPRRVAAVTIAQKVAKERSWKS